MTKEVNLIGIYRVAEQPYAYPIELIIKAKPADISVHEFVQRKEGVPRDDWQVPWDEKYLNNEGDTVTGDWLNKPKDVTDTTRLTFFLHFVNFKQPLSTPFGDIGLMLPTAMPERLSAIIQYEEPG
ncbi:hypothetical protein AAHN97_15915 [Chitinophaga niabensis]|uniref:hypothetical protein n=1 Tax=Chitinophaga niabensis TaxID=536979 RepID=UPI0031B9EC1A